MKKNLFVIGIVFLFVSCGSLVERALLRAGVLEDRALVEYRSSKTKEMAFIYMHHIGTELFYENVSHKVDSLQKEGYISFCEGVENTKETDSSLNDLSNRKVRKILGVVTRSYYDSISNKLAGKIKYKGDKKLINQPSYKILKVDTTTSVKADVELKILINEFESRHGFVQLSDCDMNTSLESTEYECETIGKELSKKFRTEIVLDYRNEHLANRIMNFDSDKVLVIYGANHFKGLWKELDKIDSTWQYDDSFPEYLDREIIDN